MMKEGVEMRKEEKREEKVVAMKLVLSELGEITRTKNEENGEEEKGWGWR